MNLDMVQLAEDAFIKQQKEERAHMTRETEIIMRYSYAKGAEFWLARGLEMGIQQQKRKVLAALGVVEPLIED